MNVRSPKFYPQRADCRPEDYHKFYRFSEENVLWLAEYFLGNTVETRGGGLTSKQKMQIFLRYVSDPGFQIGVAKDIGVNRTTVCKIIKYVLEKILDKANVWIRFPQENELLEAHLNWAARFRFPGAVGAIDCTHIRIMKPSRHGDEYCNRKGYFSVNVQATCNAQEYFTSIDAQWPGSVHDSRILKRSEVYRLMNRQQRGAILLGDSGYGLTPWLMVPYRDPQTPEEVAFNTLQKQERAVIERCFGQLKQRFPVLQYMIRVKLHKVSSVIISCVVLHNIAKHLRDDLPLNEINEIDDGAIDNDDDNNDNDNIRRLGHRRREEIKNIIFQFRN